MKIYLYIISIIATILFAGCTENDDIFSPADEEHVYSFIAVLGDEKPQSRISYQEDEETKNLKLHWDDGDIIRLYPDASMNDDTEYYEFVAHTSQRTRRCAFIYQGVIPNWEHWSGKAVLYVFPDGENLNVEDDSKEFEAKILTQKANNSTEHLKYAEHLLDEDGTKRYRDFWMQNVKDFNLKDNYELRFTHAHTIIYALKLRGFIYNIPGGSVLKVRGASWPEGEISLKLGNEDDEDPFLEVGEFGLPGYKANEILTAYIIRQVSGDTDGSIKKGEKLKIELLSYDKEDGTAYPLVAEDKQTHRRSQVDANGYGYFVNQPWGDEYTWEVTASAGIDYNVGDYVVADLTDLNKSANYPRIAIDLGMPRKWAAYNVGAKEIADYGKLFAWGYTDPHNLYHVGETSNFPTTPILSWTPGDANYDAATALWGDEWITPTEKEVFDLIYYSRMIDDSNREMPLATIGTVYKKDQWADPTHVNQTHIWKGTDECFLLYNGIRFARFRSTFNNRYFYWHMSGRIDTSGAGYDPGTRGYFITNSWYLNTGPLLFSILYQENNTVVYNPISQPYNKAYSIRPVKRSITN